MIMVLCPVNLTFPRKHLNSPVFLSFKLDGQYPLNDARTIFGETFEKTVEDINATNFFALHLVKS